MPTIGELVISMRADIAGFRTDMAQANAAVKSTQTTCESARASVEGVLKAVAGLVAVREVVGFMEQSVAATREWADKLAMFQSVAGLASEKAAALAASAELAGVGADVVTQAMARLGTAIATHPQRFEQLGISIRAASGQFLPMTQILRNTIGGLDEYKAGTDRATAAGYLFGRGAEAWLAELDKLGPQLKAANWQQNADLVNALGLSMGNAKERAAQWAAAEGTLKLELLGIQTQIGDALLPAIKTLGVDVAGLAKNGDLKRWAEEGARAVIDLTLSLARMTDYVASHNESIGILLGTAGGVAAATAPSVTVRAAGAVAFLAGLKMTGSAADEAAAKVHANTQKMIADLEAARDQIGKIKQPGVTPKGAGGDDSTDNPDGTKSFPIGLTLPYQQLDAQIAALTARFQTQISQHQQLIAAMAKSGDAAKALADKFAAEDKIMAIRAEAQRLGIKLTDAQTAALEKLAVTEGMTADLLQKQTHVSNDLASFMAKQKAAQDALAESADALTKKEQDLADAEGAVWAAFNQGVISADELQAKMQVLIATFNGPNKGQMEFTKGLSEDLDSLVGKVTDFNALIDTAKRGGPSIFKQLAKDAEDFIATLEKLIFKLAVVNPMLNALGLGDQGGGKQLPTLWGNSSGASGIGLVKGGPGPTAPAGAPASSGAAGGLSSIPFLGKLLGMFGFGGAGASAAAPAAPAAAGDYADEVAAGMYASSAGFKNGGDFVVGGNGGEDSQLVTFKASPGERVSVGMNAGRDDGSKGRGRGDTHINMPISGLHSDTFRANRHQITADVIRAVSAAGRRYA